MTNAEGLASTLQARDFDGLLALFDPDLWFRALLPREVVEVHSAAEAVALFAEWFGEPSEVELLDSQHHPAMGREFVRYRMRLRPAWAPDDWHIVEQSGYLTIKHDRIVRLDLACTGFYGESAAT